MPAIVLAFLCVNVSLLLATLMIRNNPHTQQALKTSFKNQPNPENTVPFSIWIYLFEEDYLVLL